MSMASAIQSSPVPLVRAAVVGEVCSVLRMAAVCRVPMDPRILTTPGRSTSGFHQPGRLAVAGVSEMEHLPTDCNARRGCTARSRCCMTLTTICDTCMTCPFGASEENRCESERASTTDDCSILHAKRSCNRLTAVLLSNPNRRKHRVE